MSSSYCDEGGTVVGELKLLAKPVTDAGQPKSDGSGSWLEVKELMEQEMGLNLLPRRQKDMVENRIKDVADTVDDMLGAGDEDGDGITLADIVALAETVREIIETIRELKSTPVEHPDVVDLGDRVLDYLILTYLRNCHGGVWALLLFAGAIDLKPPGEPDRLNLRAVKDLV